MLNKTKLEGKTKEEILNKYLSENNLEEKDIFYTESEIKGGLLKSKKVELEIVSKLYLNEKLEKEYKLEDIFKK